MSMNFMVYAIGLLGFWICGYALQMGGVGAVAALGGTPALNHEFAVTIFGKTFGLFGLKGFFLGGDSYDVGVFALFLFQMVFMDTAATIPTGAMAERWKFTSFVIFAFFMSMFVYPLFANWVWGGGWLAALGTNFGLGHGHVDFAGSSVVHMVGGIAALAGAIGLGPRIGKYTKDGRPVAIPGHHIPMAIAGTFILAFGWFGFNPGSTLGAIGGRFAEVVVVTNLAAAAGVLGAMLTIYLITRTFDIGMTGNGAIAALVAITAPSGYVEYWAAPIIGFIAGVILVVSVILIDRKLDDPVGALSAHGVAGIWGTLSCGIFTSPRLAELNAIGKPGIVYTGSFHQLGAQGLGVAAAFTSVFVVSFLVFFVIKATYGLRVTPEEERYGLDIVEHGMWGYPEQFMPVPGSEYHPPAAPAQRPRPRPVPVGVGSEA